MSCWVMVDPPWVMRPLALFACMARAIPPMSMPGFDQNVLSSIAIVAFCIVWGTASSEISSRRSSASV